MQPHLLAFALDFFRLSIWLLLLMLIFIPLEKIAALHPQKIFRKAFVPDLGYYFLNNLLPPLLLILPMALVGAALQLVLPRGLQAQAAALSLPLRFLAALIVGEIGFYWGHRWSHEIPFLWRFHRIHHSAEEMDWLVNTHAHPLDMVFTRLCGFIPIYVLGLAQPRPHSLDPVSLLVILLGTLWGFFIHANLNWRFGPLEWLVSTPAFHHWHHTYQEPLNKNYASMLPWVDRLFGTWHMPKAQWPLRYGIEAPVAQTWAAQLLEPLMPSPRESPPVESPALPAADGSAV
jgi:sterol desaturase/sphingolipid hydroxylase (fatty acid hydroxylase superfamily)